MIDYETLYYYLGVMKQQLRKTGGFRIPYLNCWHRNMHKIKFIFL